MKKLFALLLALTLVLSATAVCAESAEAAANAYLMYANGDWSAQNWGTEDAEGVKVTAAAVTGEGDYTVGIEFENEAAGLAFTAVGIKEGEKTLPNYYIRINEIKVNGEAIAFGKGYTSSDDGIETRMNIYNEWVPEVPAEARSYDGFTGDTSPVIVDPAAFESVKSVEVSFSVLKYALDAAYIMYANSDWSAQNWGTESSDAVTVVPAAITGPGDYVTSIEFPAEAEGLAFTALGMVNGEWTYPGAFLRINEIRLNGEPIAFTKGYTSSDNGIETRMNIYNEWVAELPADARSYDGSLEEASPMIVDPALFSAVKSLEVAFSLVPVTDNAYIMYADPTWSVQNWGIESAEGVTVVPAKIEGPGTYTTSVAFATPAEGVAFTALGIVTGEQTFPGYFIEITDISVNGEPVAFTKGYTSSDNGIETRTNIFNEWVGEVPADARSFDGVTEDVSPVIVDPAAFASVSEMAVTFNYIYGKAPEPAAQDSLDDEEAKNLIVSGLNAYIGLQCKDTYVFRNMWNDSYGKDDAEHNYFDHLTAWAAFLEGDELAEDGSCNYGGSFTDTVITGPGEYSVSVTTDDHGFGTSESFNLLFVSTDIPSSMIRDSQLTISNVRTKIGTAPNREYTDIDTTGTYALIRIIDTYNQTGDPFGYMMPGANETITVTFDVSCVE